MNETSHWAHQQKQSPGQIRLINLSLDEKVNVIELEIKELKILVSELLNRIDKNK